MNYTQENIETLQPNEVFVFGSNMNGNHAGGAARTAVEKFGAIEGQAEGLQGQSYAIPTLDKQMQKVTLEELGSSIHRLYDFARNIQEKTFLMTKIGCGIAGFKVSEIISVLDREHKPDNVVLPKAFSVVKAYKGFNKDMTCRGYQYKEGESYEESEAKLCNKGFHACESPIDCLQFYEPGKSVYHKVELDEVSDEQSDIDTKVVSKKIKIGAKLGVPEICQLTFEYVKEHCTNEHNAEKGKPATAGNRGAATAGNRGAATAGEYGAATAGEYGAATAGYRGAATAGEYGAATAGEYGAATAGEYGAATAGNCGAATAGEYGAATAGNRGAATAGEYGAATAGYGGAATAGNCGAATSRGSSSTGYYGLSVARGNNVKVRGGIGAILVIAEESTGNYDIIDWKAVVVDGKKIKANTWYKLVNGKLVEAEE